MNKISIIGAGSVGATIAYTLAVTGLASEVVLIDINTDKAEGEALDIRQGIPCSTPCSVYAGTYEDAVRSNIVILASGVARKAGQSRLDLAQTNVDITKTIIPQITKYAPDANYIIVSNPVDILTYTFCKCSGLPENRIIGSGTVLDTSRLRSRIADDYSININNVHAYVLGEHGDSSMVPWSLANISNLPISYYKKGNVLSPDKLPAELDREELENYVKKSGGTVISLKGATYYAIAMSVHHICRSILSDLDTAMTVSTMMHGEYGIEDVCLSILNVVGDEGAHSKILLPLTAEEELKLRHSADVLKSLIKEIKI